jgi:peptidoglycan L-alanyl-D-glutamate endopeptidase CwlK
MASGKRSARKSSVRTTRSSTRAPGPPSALSTTGRDVDSAHLHPEVRARVERVLTRLAAERIPFRLFEGYRAPQRQQYLWDQGRVRPGAKVTNAPPWRSMHQYGLAVDLVLWENGKWSWDDRGPKAAWWKRLKQVGREEGLTSISWEAPHLELAGVTLAQLQRGDYPDAGDETWAAHLVAALYGWTGTPLSPPLPRQVPERPPLPAAAAAAVATATAALPAAGSAGWHARFGGREWRHDERGVYLRTHAEGREPLRSPGEPVTMRAIWQSFGGAIATAAQRFGLPPALIMTMIANETGNLRKFGFTGPLSFRWEPHVLVNDVNPARRGDYSAGPMQVLASTARWIVRAQRLAHDPFAVAPAYEMRPEPPAGHPMYDPALNIELGTAVIKQRWAATGADPILAAAAYNAGGVYRSSENPWRLRCYGDHLDRTARWYGDACSVLREAGVVTPPTSATRRRAAAGRRGRTARGKAVRAGR